ncbi:MAG TPA: hypothetical protein VGB17_17235 [Pyrinomonadaceae bacterium]|jgi:hypothetical protein
MRIAQVVKRQQSLRITSLFLLLLATVLVQGCQHNARELLLNQSATRLGSHKLLIRPSSNLHESTHAATEIDKADGKPVYRFTAGQTTLVIKNEVLSVNGKSYGTLNAGDSVTVDYGRVLVNDKEVKEAGTLASR